MAADRTLTPGLNCWRIEAADRVAFLLEGERYFAAFREAVLNARHRIFILGWDIDSNLRLIRDGDDDGGPLGPFLNQVVSERPDLEAYLLIWDFAMIYALDREWLPVYRLGWKTHQRLHFRLDDRHPVGGSQHQKIVVIDDRIAFVGGMDLGKWRWDTADHAPGDDRRRDALGNRYMPYHDVQALVSGDAAVALGDLARERWRRATGERLEPPGPVGDPWPASVVPDLRQVRVGIARTEPRYGGRREVREVERLYLDSIAAARRSLYIENQYLTSKVIGDALAARLREPDGPEIVIVVPRKTGGWLEQNTMDVLRRRLVRLLRSADHHGRLRIMWPDIPGLAPVHLSVHSKLMIADDALVRLGSANLSNRSMGLDSECDICIEAQGDPEAEAAIRRLRDRLLGEHLGVAPAAIAESVALSGSLVETVDTFSDDGRTLRPLEDEAEVDPDLAELIERSHLIDPERPVSPEQLAERVVPQEQRRTARRGIVFVTATLVVFLALAAAWRWTPLGEWLDVESMTAMMERVRNSLYAPVLVLGGYVLGGLLVVPVTFLVAVTVITFGSLWGFLYGIAGSLLSAAVVFGLGHLLGRNAVRQLAGSRLNRLSQGLARRGVLAIVTVRMVPVAPFTVVNLVAGVSHIRFGKFMLGTLLGMAPGILGMALFIDRLIAAIRSPDAINFLLVAGVVLLLIAGGLLLRRWLRGRRRAVATDRQERCC